MGKRSDSLYPSDICLGTQKIRDLLTVMMKAEI